MKKSPYVKSSEKIRVLGNPKVNLRLLEAWKQLNKEKKV